MLYLKSLGIWSSREHIVTSSSMYFYFIFQMRFQYVAQDELKYEIPPASVSQWLGPHGCATTQGLCFTLGHVGLQQCGCPVTPLRIVLGAESAPATLSFFF